MRQVSRTTHVFTPLVLAAMVAAGDLLPLAASAAESQPDLAAGTASVMGYAAEVEAVAIEGVVGPGAPSLSGIVPIQPAKADVALRPRTPGTPLVPQGGPVKISAPLVALGDVLTYAISPDVSRVVYVADQDVNDTNELYSVPLSGGIVTQLNAPLVALGQVLTFGISSDSTTVVYRADQDVDGVDELFSVPIVGGAPTQLNPPLPALGDVLAFVISPDASRVVYAADQDVDTVVELYSVPIAGGTVTKLNGTLVANGDVLSFGSTADSSRAFYRADQITDTVDEVFSVPIAGGPVTKLNGTLVANGDVTSAFSFTGRTYYFADQDTDLVLELYSVPDAGGTVVKLNGPLVAGGNVGTFWAGFGRLAYIADEDANEVFEVYAVPTTGGTSIKLNPALPLGGDVFQIQLPDADMTVVYRADQDADGVIEFYSVPAAGGASTQLNGPLVPGGNVLGFGVSVPNTLPARTLYLGDQDTDEVIEVYSTPFPSGAATKLNPPMVAGGDFVNGTFSASGILVYRADQDADEVIELYTRTTTALGPASKLNAALVASGDVLDFAYNSTAASVVYRADQDADEVQELYSVFLDGDADADAVVDGLDCLAYDAGVWDLPGEATDLVLSHTGGVGGTTALSWTAPTSLGGIAVAYDTIRSSQADDFVTSATCVETDDGSDTAATDPDTPATGEVFFFLVRAENICGGGSVGTDSTSTERTARLCT